MDRMMNLEDYESGWNDCEKKYKNKLNEFSRKIELINIKLKNLMEEMGK